MPFFSTNSSVAILGRPAFRRPACRLAPAPDDTDATATGEPPETTDDSLSPERGEGGRRPGEGWECSDACPSPTTNDIHRRMRTNSRILPGHLHQCSREVQRLLLPLRENRQNAASARVKLSLRP